VTRDGVAVNALALLREPLDEGGGIGDLAARFRQRLALLRRHQLRQVFLVRHHEIEELAQHDSALLAGARAPFRQRALGRFDGAARLVGAHLRDMAEDGVIGGVVDRDRLPVAGIDPHAIDIALLAEELLVLELHLTPPVARFRRL
jgi:hypothetical protein